MAWTYGFFNSINGDRKYNADQMSRIFEGLITNGVYESVANKLAVQPNSGMVIQIGTGRGWFGGHWLNNDSEYLLTLEDSDVILNRYVAVCVRVDESNENRNIIPYLKYSEFASSPVKPTMERGEVINEYCLAYIYIKAKATAITSADIEDTRGDNDLCGWVTGLITQLSTTTLFEQWTAIFNNWSDMERQEFNKWFNDLQDLIDENVEVMLVNALPVGLEVTLSSNGWSEVGGVLTQTVQVMNMNATKCVIVQPEDATKEAFNDSEIKAVSQGVNELTFTAVERPTTDIQVKVLHMGV